MKSNKNQNKIAKLMGRLGTRRYAAVSAGLVVFIATFMGGAYLLTRNFEGEQSKGAPAGTNIIRLIPSKSNLAQNEAFTLRIEIDAGDPINSVQFGLNLPSQVTYLGTFTNSSDFPSDIACSPASQTCFVRYNLNAGAGMTGVRTVLTLDMRATAGSGSANISFNSNQTVLAGAGVNRNKTETGTSLTFFTPDTTPPTVSITAPANNSYGYGNVTVQATASDNSGTVSKVEFRIDGTLRSTDTSAPFTTAWDTAGLPLGAHTVQARAYDASNNTTNSSISVKVAANTCGASKRSDINCDGSVSLVDLSTIITNWGQPTNGNADIVIDGTTSLVDLSDLITNWGAAPLL